MKPETSSMTRRGSVLRKAPAALAAAVALVASFLVMDGRPSGADPLMVSNVSVSLSVPATTATAFAATGTVTNSGTLSQAAGSTVRISAASGTVGGLPAGCALSAGAAVCTAGALAPGQSQSFTVTITPALNAASVATTAHTQANQLDLNAPTDPNDDTVSKSTQIVYSLSAAITSNPSDVQQGSDTLLTSSVTNTGLPQSSVTLHIATGGTVDTALPLPAGCAADPGNTSATCGPMTLATNETRSFDIAATSPTSGSSMVSTATASGANGSTASASVTTTLSPNSQAFVAQGGSLSFTSPNITDTFEVPQGAAPGIFLRLNEADVSGTMCGSVPCKPKAAEAIFPSQGKYQATDPNHPLVWNIAYTEKQVCNGKGFPSGCLMPYWIGSGSTVAAQLQPCPTYSQNQKQPARMADANVPCLNFLTKTNGNVTYQVALLKDIQIPVISK